MRSLGSGLLIACDLHKETQRYTGPFELAEPDEEEPAWVREIMGREPP